MRVLGLIALWLGVFGHTAWAAPLKPEATTFPRDIVNAWTEAGATVGWVGFRADGTLAFQTTLDGLHEPVPGFTFQRCSATTFKGLPIPRVRFGLDLNRSGKEITIDDHALPALKAYTDLQYLNLAWSAVTDEGFKTIAQLPRLQALNLSSASVLTDAGIKHLTALDGLRYLDLSDTQVGDKVAAYLCGLRSLHVLNLQATKLTNTGLRTLAEHPALRSLGIGDYHDDTSITDEGLKPLAKLQTLEKLDAGFAQINGTGLKYLRDLPKFKVLILCNTNTNDAGLKAIGQLKHLQELNLHAVPLTDEGLAALSQLRDLRVLSLLATRVGDRGLAHIVQCRELRSLNLGHAKNRVTDEGVRLVATLLHLETLHLEAAPITAKGLDHLETVKSLKSLNIISTKLSDREVAKFMKALPECRVRK